MADEAAKTTSLPVGTLVTIVALASGIALYALPVTSSRPAGEADASLSAESRDRPNARLWQDPLSAVTGSLAGARGSSAAPSGDHAAGAGRRYDRNDEHSIERFVEQRWSRGAEADERRTILAVVIPDGPYAENVESRLRARQAVVEGLAASHFDPSDPTHLDYLTLPRSFGLDDSPDPCRPWPANRGTDCPDDAVVVPVESFHATRAGALDGGERVSTLVLWLRSDVFHDHPLRRLAALFAALSLPGRGTCGGRTHCAVLGPADSGGLRAMLEEAVALTETERCALEADLSGVRIESALPTVADGFLALDLASGCATPSAKCIVERSVPGVRFDRTIATDDVVLGALVGELARRGVAPAEPGNGETAIISESDTLHGRALPWTFETAALEISPAAAVHCDERPPVGECAARAQIRRYHYLRGIDGKLPGDKDAEKRKKSSGDSPTAPPGPPSEATEGLDQSDYLRRLAEQLHERDVELRSNGSRGVVAVGVLGFDIYDKLMILRALRRTLPSALFFTNNLDARLALPSEWEGAHNLVVASPFGLTMGAGNGGFPPFRDSYQTSTFAAVRAVLADDELGRSEEPHLFEIGVRGAYELDPPTAGGAGAAPAADGNAQAVVRAIARRIGAALAGAALLIGLLAWAFWQHRDGRFRWSDLAIYTPLAVCELAVTAVLLVFVLHFLEGSHSEPLALLAGISIWPSEAIRFLAGGLALHFVAKSMAEIRESDRRLTAEFFPDLLPGPERGVAAARCGDVQPDDARAIWTDYLEAGGFVRRLLRILPVIAAYWLFGLALMALLGFPNTPARSVVAGAANFLITVVFAVGASIFLLFFVIDAMIVNRRFIDRIMAADVAWPASLVERWCEATSEDARLCARRFLAVRLVAERTSVVIDLIYYPFVVLLLMIFSRVHYFDNWDWPLGLLAVLGLNAAGAVFAGFTLRSAAENGRRRALAELSEKLFAAAVGRSGDPAERDREALEFGIEAIERRKDGAFSSFAENPVLRALLLPSGGFGLIALAQLFPAFH